MPNTKSLRTATELLETLKHRVGTLENLIQDLQQMPVYRDAGRKEAFAELAIAKEAELAAETATSIGKVMSESAHKGFFKTVGKQ